MSIAIIENNQQIKTYFYQWLEKDHKHLLKTIQKKENLYWFDPDTSEQEIKDIFILHAIKKIQFFQNRKQIPFALDFFAESKKRITQIHNERSVNRTTFSRFEKIWLRNVTQNTTQIIESYPLLALKNFGKNYPALIVGAGPSLSQHLDLLKKHQNQIFIIACDTVLKVLLFHDITPDLVVVVDPQKINSKYLENIPAKYLQNTILVSEPGVCNQGIRNFPHLIMYDSIFPFYLFLSHFFNKKGEIDIGGSVLTAAYEIARVLNFSNIAFTGMDFCFQENSYHLPGTMYEEIFFSLINRFHSFEMFFSKIINNEIIHAKNHLDQPIYVDQKFLLFKDWFEKKIEKEDQHLFNCSWGGLSIDGLPFLQLNEYLTKYTKTQTDKRKLTQLLKEKTISYQKMMSLSNPDFKKIFLHFQNQFNHLIKSIEDYQKKLQRAVRHLQNKQFDRAMKLQHEIINDQKMKIAKPFIEIVIQKTLYEINQHKSSPNDETESIKHLYEELISSCTLNLLYLNKAHFHNIPLNKTLKTP